MGKVAEIIWNNIQKDEQNEELIEQVIQKCFEVENINPTSFYICVTLTNPEEINKINKQYRNIDKPTDVLSFPMFEKKELDELIKNNLSNEQAEEKSLDKNDIEALEETTQDILGDIIISVPQVEVQAKEYGHSFTRELAYMVVHGFYHLRGYDHMTEEEKTQMREREENVLMKLNITR